MIVSETGDAEKQSLSRSLAPSDLNAGERTFSFNFHLQIIGTFPRPTKLSIQKPSTTASYPIYFPESSNIFDVA